MARAPFTYPFCYTPAPDIVAAAQELISTLDAAAAAEISDRTAVALENRSHPRLDHPKNPGIFGDPGCQPFEGPAACWDGGQARLSDVSTDSGRGPAQPDVFRGNCCPGISAAAALQEGKMLGVLKVMDEMGREDFLYAFSGTVGGRATLPGFVPPIYDLTAPDGYFRRREAEISAMPAGPERSAASAALQAWIFDQYRVSNARGETLSIREVFARRGLVPPGGTGDCAAPKLLQYAYDHRLVPLAMGEFWYGASPASEVRSQGRFYPSCTGKCGPLLTFMLEGLEVEANPLDREFTAEREPAVLYEDPVILVAGKPAGMLAVPGRTRARSLLEWLRERYGEVYSCHRLDMDTSGVMVFARTPAARSELERQFADREVSKTYRARLVASDRPFAHARSGTIALPLASDRPFAHARSGTIALPLASDYYDRPRQLVDREHGKWAVTGYEVLAELPDGEIDVRFTPLTGRTHQIRVHAAHADGLGRPVKGDRLYGSPDGGRLWLHAETLTFRHPGTGECMTFRDLPE